NATEGSGNSQALAFSTRFSRRPIVPWRTASIRSGVLLIPSISLAFLQSDSGASEHTTPHRKPRTPRLGDDCSSCYPGDCWLGPVAIAVEGRVARDERYARAF